MENSYWTPDLWQFIVPHEPNLHVLNGGRNQALLLNTHAAKTTFKETCKHTIEDDIFLMK